MPLMAAAIMKDMIIRWTVVRTKEEAVEAGSTATAAAATATHGDDHHSAAL